MLKQTRISFQPHKRDIYITETIRQQGALFPWQVKIEGWLNSGLSVRIDQAQLKEGYMIFTGLKFRGSRHFAEFVSKMLHMVRFSFKKDISFSGNDYLALMEGYEKGVKRARSCYISTNSKEGKNNG